MTVTDDRRDGIKIAYIGGGSRGWAWGLMSDLSQEAQLSGIVRLYDIDKAASKSNEIIGNMLYKREGIVGKWTYESMDTLKDTLTDVDFIIISILPGTFDEMASDVHFPERYGVYQAVGDSVGPGGLMRGLRTIPMYAEIAKAIKAYAPEAWVINFTNPMALCTRTLYEIFPKIKAFGNCHEVFGTQKLLASALDVIEGIKDVKRDEIKVNVYGINHFTWLDSASYKGLDLMPVYKKFVDQYAEDGFEDGKTGNWLNDSFSSAHRVKFDLFKRYGVIAAAGDRHLAEFCSRHWYLKNEATVEEWKFGLTQVSWRKTKQKELLEQSRKMVSGDIEFEIKETGEEGVRQMKALLGLGDFITNVNLPNYGQVENLPLGCIVETNAVFQKNKVTPVFSGKLPLPILGMVNHHVINQEMILHAALNEDKELAFQAFIQDPLLQLPMAEARECFEAMLLNTNKYHTFQ